MIYDFAAGSKCKQALHRRHYNTHTHTHTRVADCCKLALELFGAAPWVRADHGHLVAPAGQLLHGGHDADLGRPGRHGKPEQVPGGGFLKIIPIGIPTYAGMKIGFHADVSPRNWFSCRRRSEYQLKKSVKTRHW